ncbi:unnamed protein product [Nesidiocoris tenuis]|uniref:BTB domain-containing protein n=1 Tax=Nesidiocoris tenuis TaxID=355587 RepID=A0A6H5GAF5_9HEMI|nr:unnamed protein product [Nesidiocoris tenuis]
MNVTTLLIQFKKIMFSTLSSVLVALSYSTQHGGDRIVQGFKLCFMEEPTSTRVAPMTRKCCQFWTVSEQGLLTPNQCVMDGTQFLVQWEEHPSHLSSRLGYLLERQSLVDVTLMCNTHTLKVHRAVLAACSPYFEVSPKSAGFDPVRRNRKRGGGLSNSTFRDRLIRGQDPLVNENFRRDLNDEGDVSSPLLSSLLTKPPISGATKNSCSPNSTANKYLREMNEQGHVPILVDNGEGKLITLSNDLLNSSFINDPPPTLPSPVSLNGSTSSYIVEELQVNRPGMAEPTATLSLAEVTGPKASSDEVLDEEMIQSLRNGAASEAENEPEAVVLFEVTENKKVEKYVVSAKEVSLLKSLNETLTQQKKELADITKNNNINTIDVAGSNAKVAELILKINKTKSILSQVVGYAQTVKDKLKGALKAEAGKDEKSANKSQTVQLEFIDGNGEKIEGYQVTGTLVDKKESRDELMGLFDLVNEPTNQNPLLGEGQPAIDKDKLEVESSYRLEDNTENMSFHIDDMMNDASSNIVIEDKSQDFKYIMDNDGNIQDEHYVVYESENVIYDGALGGDDSSQAIHDDEAEYVVYSDDPISKAAAPTDGHDYLCYNNSKVDDESDFAVYPPEGVLSSSDKLDLQANIVDDPVYHHDNPTVDGYSDDLDPISTPQVLSCPSSPSASAKMESPPTKRLVADLDTTPSPGKKSRLSHDL